MTIHVDSVNDLPTSEIATATATEHLIFSFEESDFPYADVELSPMTQLRLQSVNNGTFGSTMTATTSPTASKP